MKYPHSSYTKYRNEQLEPYVPGEPYCKIVGKDNGFDYDDIILFFTKDGDIPRGTPSTKYSDGVVAFGFNGVYATFQDQLNDERRMDNEHRIWLAQTYGAK